MKSEEEVLEKTKLKLYGSRSKSGWKSKAILRQNMGSLLKKGVAQRFIYYAVKHRCKRNVKEFVLTEMVSSGNFKTKYAAMETIMIEDLWDSFGWRETSIDRVKNLVTFNKMGLIVDRLAMNVCYQFILPFSKLDVWILRRESKQTFGTSSYQILLSIYMEIATSSVETFYLR